MTPIAGKAHDLGDGFLVTRLLPQIAQRTIGPFVFFDYFGPSDFPPGKGIDVRPHPHIGLATLTYLFDGAQVHRDTLGSVQEITPGDVNWMTAGRGIAHSERTGMDMRAHGHRLHGIQTWIGLPKADEEIAPAFQHFSRTQLPEQEESGVKLRLIAGEAFGLKSPVQVYSPMFYGDARFSPGGALRFVPGHQERAFFVVQGEIQTSSDYQGVAVHGQGAMLMLDEDEDLTLYSDADARIMLLGGAKLDGPRHIWWNFVSSSMHRIERAKQDWKDGKFGLIPGDEQQFIPLPEDRQRS